MELIEFMLTIFPAFQKQNYMKLFFALLIIILLCQCKSRLEITDRNNSIITDSAFNFFPHTTSNIILEKVVTNATLKNSNQPLIFFNPLFYVELIDFKESVEFNEEIAKNERISKSQFMSQDSCYFIIGSEWEMTKTFDSADLIKKYDNIQLNQIIPFFGEILSPEDNCLSSNTICGLTEGYKIMILSSEYRCVVKDGKLKNINGWSALPIKLKHGYIRGLAFSTKEQRIIYWVVTW